MSLTESIDRNFIENKFPETEKTMNKPDLIPQHEPGAKLDHDKMDMSLLQLLPNALEECCRVMDYGQTKYSRGGFLSVPDAFRRYTSAFWRHWLKEPFEKYDSGDPFYDTPKGLPFKGKVRHDAQVAVNALFRLEIKIREELAQEQAKDAAIEGYYEDKKRPELKYTMVD
jgi:hypothetical protein